MFLKRTKSGPKNNKKIYLQIAQSFRNKDGQPRQKIIGTLGREDQLKNSDQINQLIKKLAKLTDQLILIDKDKDQSGKATLFGSMLALESLWKTLKLETLFQSIQNMHQFTYDLNQIVKLMVLNRLIAPSSKRSLMEWKEKIFDQPFENIDLHQLYRSLTVLGENKDLLQQQLFQTSESLFKPQIRLVFYDLTTTYFESSDEDALRRFGYSKDNKTDCVQVVIGLLVSEDNVPLGYEVFPGNTFEGKTVKSMIDKLTHRFEIEKVVLVGDKGLLSKSVLEELEKQNYQYIVASKLSQTKTKYHESILDKASYTPIGDDVCLKEIEVDSRRLILGHSEKRSRRDRAMREKVLEKLNKKLSTDPKSIGAKSPYRKYLQMDRLDVKIDPVKIESQSRWDGFFGFYCNDPSLSKNQILESYRMLWQIEESFRCMKSTLDLRPIYHWTEPRIEGHIMLCFLSFYVLRALQRFVQDAGVNLSAERILDSLSEVVAFEIKTSDCEYWIRSEISGDANLVLRALKCKIPSLILKEKSVVE